MISESEKRKHFFKTSQYEIGEKAVNGSYRIARLLSGLFLFKKKTLGVISQTNRENLFKWKTEHT